MSKYKRVTIISLAIVLSILFIGSTAPCKPPDDKPGKSEPELIITDSSGNEITEVTLTVDERFQFSAEIVDDGNMDTSGIAIEWRVLGSIGDIDSMGNFTATKVGRGMVGASAKIDKKPLTAYVVVKVSEGEPPPGEGKRIVVVIEPESVELQAGGTQSFEVLEPEVEPDDNIQWRVIPPKLGYIVQDGNTVEFIAGQDPGKGLIIATVQTAGGKGTGRAKVLVTGDKLPSPGPKLKVNIVPKHARVDNGGSVEFEAKVTGPEAHYVPEWEVNPLGAGEIEGEGERVIFNAASTEGEFKGRALVIARIQTETEFAMDWATVDIGGPVNFLSKVKVSVDPEEWSMVVNEVKDFTANGVPVEQTAQLTWSVAPVRLGIIENITGNSVQFRALSPGWGLIIAKLDTEKGTAVGKAKVYVGTLAIKIEPPAKITAVNSVVNFQVTDMQDNPVTDVPIQWKAVPSSLGTIGGEGSTAVFEAGGKAGHVLITAKVVGPKGGSTTAQARVTITDDIIGVATGTGKLQVTVNGSESVSVNGTYTYTASVEGVLDPGELEFKWRVASPSIGKLTGDSDTATFTPRKAGRCAIIVDVQGPQGTGTGRISVTVNE